MDLVTLDVPVDLPDDPELSLRHAVALDVVFRLTGGIEGAWCSSYAAHQVMLKRGFPQGCLSLKALARKGLLLRNLALRPDVHDLRPYSKHAIFYHQQLVGLTREGFIEHWTNVSRVDPGSR